jgi:hypothetical protein
MIPKVEGTEGAGAIAGGGAPTDKGMVGGTGIGAVTRPDTFEEQLP